MKMIIKNHQINDILSDKSKLIAILVYGPNEGLVRENINLIKNMKKTNNVKLLHLKKRL